ncbi:DUF4349 domain-containing protein [Mucilaginibacter sp. PAMB04274]|uniref:DUF4349 domain-containing protein n=1 Tax=Mucilaginibacter sp. PAMB04274 TaxID=3138568 RepID=UPI0031F618F0
MKLYILILACLYITACQNGNRSRVDSVKFPPPMVKADEQYRTQEIMLAPPAANAQPVVANGVSIDKKVIKEGEISLEINNLKTARKIITDTLNKLGGYIDEESENNNADVQRKEYILKVRIPAQNFDRFISDVSASADRIESKSIRIKDVTTEYIDISTRLNNQKLLEDRYKALLQKAGKMADILEVENKLTEIRTNIETTQGQLNYLNKQIAYSSLEITFFTQSTVGKNEGDGFGYKFKSAVNQSWQLLQDIFFGIITIWPVVMISILLFFVFRAVLRKRRQSRGM